jgi:hypothetical protein
LIIFSENESNLEDSESAELIEDDVSFDGDFQLNDFKVYQ